MMNKKEAAIVSAYTGYLIGSFSEMHKYANELFGRPIYTHEFGSEDFSNELRDKSKSDYVALSDNISP
jgi:hypothetical protein